MISSKTTFWGYRRENGRVGVRNYVAILPVDDISNAACEAVAAHIQGTIALPHASCHQARGGEGNAGSELPVAHCGSCAVIDR